VPITNDKVYEAASLTRTLTSFHILVDNATTVSALHRAAPPSETKKWSVFLMVDCG
jgi:hypothetical protein